ncbi:hypothetical protein BC629DRAFT_1584115 [Irpex lacteus]|nr:hypothetical protein BC629DRAFT_1584115 [Irpex lacteus]
MAPKNKGKKGKKQDDDDFWETAGTSVAGNNLAAPGDASEDDAPSSQKAGGFSAFASLGSVIKASSNKGKKDKKKNKRSTLDDEPEETNGEAALSKAPVEVTADDLADEEWGPVKGKKGKKGKGKKGKAAQDDEDEDAAPEITLASPSGAAEEKAQAPTSAPAPGVDEADEEEDGGPKVLSKKEKEKLKKEREKAKKKAQAAAKKAGQADPAETPAPEAAAPLATVDKANEDDEEGEEGAAGGASSKKKKKKKAKKDEEPAAAPTPAAGKKKGASGIKKKRLEEEARQREEEERKRIEEEERKAAEEEKRKEEEKQRRKEKEKAKRRLLTKKQKEEQRVAELRKQALLASGQQDTPASKKPKGPTAAADHSPAASPAPAPAPDLPAEPEATPKADSVKDDWDASSEDEAPAAPEGIKESWDDSSEDEEEKPAATGGAAKAAVPAKTAAPAKAAKAEPAKAAPEKSTPAKAVPSKKEDSEDESSSEESSSEEDSDDSDSDSDSESDEGLSKRQQMVAQKKAEAAERRKQAHEAALAARSAENLRSPICCILGHVDTGKTKLLDKIRQTNVQEGEAGGITQQIVMNKDGKQEYKIPGLLIIDTPGHESFTNLRSRGSSLCNIAILVVDIMHGLEPQTLESLRLLRDRKTPFIVALNKIDRMYGWEATPDNDFRSSLAKQKRSVQREFEDRCEKTRVAFAEQGLNAVLYYENKNFARNVSLVPTSAITGEGVPDMIMLLVNLTQQRMSDRLMYLSELECTVLEVKVIEGLGTTIDVVLSNGILHEGDRIVVCGLNGPIVTQVRALLTPQPLRELRIKSAYVHHKEIVAPDLEKAIAGSRLMVVGPDDDEDEMMDEIMSDLTTLLNSIDKSGRGVCVQASTLGSLEALLDFLKVSKIPVSGINIGPVHKKDIMRAATMLEKAKELACILCFDVTVDREAERLAEEMGIRLFKADIIYHLFDAFTAYNAEIQEAKRRDAAPQAVWPCRLKTIACFAKREPIILGVDILDGTLRVGTPLHKRRKSLIWGRCITSLEINHKSFDVIKKSRLEHAVYQSAKMFGRHFDEKDEIYSHITRQSIDVLKASFKADVSNEEWLLIKALKPRLNIQTVTQESTMSNTVENRPYADASEQGSIDSDEAQLVINRSLMTPGFPGIFQQLHRTWRLVESFCASFVALNFIGGVRGGIFLGLLAGGPAAIWSSYIVSMIFMFMTAFVLAEICSALPLSGSIYVWAAESAGPKYARFFGFIVAWWSCTAWMTFAAGNCQATANYIVSQLAVWEVEYPGGIGNDNVKWRALIWAVSEGLLLCAIAINYLPPRWYSAVFRVSVVVYMIDFLLCVIWLPIGVHKTYGFRSAKDVFTLTYNGTGATPGWNWILCYLFTAGTMIGFDASGHIAEETKNASVVAGRGIIYSVVATGCLGFVTAILFLFCTPDLDTLFSLGAPQPFVQLYALALGKPGSIIMTILATLGLILSTSVAIVAASRLVFAVARDGVLPLSGWIGKVDSSRQPRNAVTVMYLFGAVILCTILPSQVAFTSLVSAGAIPTTAAYGLISLLRLTMTPNDFQNSHFFLGKWRRVFYLGATLFNGLVFATQVSPFFFPVTAESFNFAPVIFGAVTIFGVISWYFVPEDKWLRRDVVLRGLQEGGGEDAVQELNRDGNNVVNATEAYDIKKKL